MPVLTTTPSVGPLEWPERSRMRRWKYTGRHREWLSRCRQYRISLCLDYPCGGYLACVREALDGWRLLGRNRTLRAAKVRCLRYRRNAIRLSNARQGRAR